MRSVVVATLACAALFAFSKLAWAFVHRCGCDDCAPTCAPACAPAPQIQWVDKVVTCYRPVMKEKQIECTIARAVPREVVTPLTRTYMVAETKMVEKTIAVCR